MVLLLRYPQIFADFLRRPQPPPLTCHLYQLVKIFRPSTSSITFPVDVSSLSAHGNSRRPSTSSTTSPVDVSFLLARRNICRPFTLSTTFPVDVSY
ncbi:hypothetical protein GLOIN_2v1766310 [Rhizophagus irregularis DAOM 181602=DAOM 197198]|nr:hypothetical protein GLOIN_2v1766310 [Rhizophagus irregularis DAOM 181602=DAOM 197198]